MGIVCGFAGEGKGATPFSWTGHGAYSSEINVLDKGVVVPWDTNPAFSSEHVQIGLIVSGIYDHLNIKNSFPGINESYSNAGLRINSLWFQIPFQGKFSAGFGVSRFPITQIEGINEHPVPENLLPDAYPLVAYRLWKDNYYCASSGVSFQLSAHTWLGVSTGVCQRTYQENRSFLYISGGVTESLESTVFRKAEWLLPVRAGWYFQNSFLKAGAVFHMYAPLKSSSDYLYSTSRKNYLLNTDYYTRDMSSNTSKSSISVGVTGGCAFSIKALEVGFQGGVALQKKEVLLYPQNLQVSFAGQIDGWFKFSSQWKGWLRIFYSQSPFSNPVDRGVYSLVTDYRGGAIIMIFQPSASPFSQVITFSVLFHDGIASSPTGTGFDVDAYSIRLWFHSVFSLL